MTVQKKLDIFAKRISDSTNEKKRRLSQEIQDAIRAKRKEAERIVRQERRMLLKVEQAKLERESQKQIHYATTIARKTLADTRLRLSAELLVDLEDDLRKFVQSHKYKGYLQKAINAAKKQVTGQFSTIILMNRDMIYKDKIQFDGLINDLFEIKGTDEDFIGGFKLLSADKRAMADYSLLARLEALNEKWGNLWD